MINNLHSIITTLLQPALFFVKPPYQWSVQPIAHETRRWENFRGQLLDPAFTRAEATFSTWHVELTPISRLIQGPIISIRNPIKQPQELIVSRSLAVYGQETYVDHGAIHSRLQAKWHEELIGIHDLSQPMSLHQHIHALQCLLQQCVNGTSRLPVTSVESPHPLYLLGIMAYFPFAPQSSNPNQQPLSSSLDLSQRLVHETDPAQQARCFDFLLRSTQPELLMKLELGPIFTISAWSMWQCLFNQLALNHSRLFLKNLALILSNRVATELRERILPYYLRHLVRHLSAYDLKRFHGQGSNYPDALFMDKLLRITAQTALITRSTGPSDANKNKRITLLQALSMRKQLEGMVVPAEPMAPGEHSRIWSETQSADQTVVQSKSAQTITLFKDDPIEQLLSDLERKLLQPSQQDLDNHNMLMELGRATFLDRPLGMFKWAQRVFQDRTPLFAYDAFSLSLARERLGQWLRWGWLNQESYAFGCDRLSQLTHKGMPVQDLVMPHARPGVIGLEDALQARPDFQILASARSSIHRFLQCYDFGSLAHYDSALSQWLQAKQCTLIVRSSRRRRMEEPRALLSIYDQNGQPKLELAAAQSYTHEQEIRYAEWAGIEYLAEGLRCLRAWNERGELLPDPPLDLRFPPKFGTQ